MSTPYADGFCYFPDSKIPGANMGPIWVLSAPDGSHVGPRNLAIRVAVCRQAISNLAYTAVYIHSFLPHCGHVPDSCFVLVIISYICMHRCEELPWLNKHHLRVLVKLSLRSYLSLLSHCSYNFGVVLWIRWGSWRKRFPKGLSNDLQILTVHYEAYCFPTIVLYCYMPGGLEWAISHYN